MAEGPLDFIMSEGDLTHHIEAMAHTLRFGVQAKLFGSVQKYYDQLAFVPPWVTQVGIDSDLSVSKAEIEPYIRQADEATLKAMYYNDVSALIGSLQNANVEVKSLLGQFYKELNNNSFILAKDPLEPNMEMHASGLIVTRIFSYVNYLFISLYSQMDYVAKICYELEHLKVVYKKYDRLQSSGILVGDANRLSFKKAQGTIFEECPNMRLIQTLRNEIIHDGSFENTPKVFQLFKDNKMVEKYIFLPDHTNGFIDSIKSRKRFFSKGIKLNECLPELITDFWKRMLTTFVLLQKSTGISSH
ncbi:hypothetical protein [Mucilaginibacter sp. PAMB04168]|uniref:hypothetical protein n=1 Tax=Mucilaginibacter sp. PAMB04168 TaxID=3138567 RepID=UPI0031F699FF